MRLFRYKYLKVISVFLALNILFQAISPTVLMALTSGPTQPEVQSFKPVEMTDMVDLFTGDFSYNIPLLDIGGYPINLSYSGNINMDQEASWVGLGWNLNPGVINRSIRGVPDDFDGDQVTREFTMMPHTTYGAKVGANGEVFGLPIGKLNPSIGISSNNYNGCQLEAGISPKIASGTVGKGKYDVTLDIRANSSNGIDLSPSVSYSMKTNDKLRKENLGFTLGSTFNSQEGIKQVSLDAYSSHLSVMGIGGKFNYSYSFATPVGINKPDMKSENLDVSFSAGVGPFAFGSLYVVKIDAYKSTQEVVEKSKNFNTYGYLYEQNASRDDILDFNREKDVAYSPQKPYIPLTNHSYDVYSVSGQGVSGSYRPYRNDMGAMYLSLIHISEPTRR